MKTIPQIVEEDHPERIFIVEGMNMYSFVPEKLSARFVPPEQFWYKGAMPLLTDSEARTIMADVGVDRVTVCSILCAEEFAEEGVETSIIPGSFLYKIGGRGISIAPEKGHVLFVGCPDCVDSSVRLTRRALDGRTYMGCVKEKMNESTHKGSVIEDIAVPLPVKYWRDQAENETIGRLEVMERMLKQKVMELGTQMEVDYNSRKQALEAQHRTKREQFREEWKVFYSPEPR